MRGPHQGLRVGVRQHHAHRRHQDEQGGRDRGQPDLPEHPGRHQQQGHRGGQDDREPDGQDLVQADPSHQQLAVDLADEDQADRVEPEQQGEGLGRGPVDLLHHEGRGGYVGEERGEGEAAGQGVAREDAVAEQPPHGPQGGADTAGVPPLGRQGLAEAAPDHQGEHRAHDGEDDEDPAPVGEAQHLAADERGDDRGGPGYEHQGGEEARHLVPVVQVAYDGPGDDDRGGAGQALEQPEGDQQLGGRGERADRRGQDVDDHADEQGPAAAPLVAHRADDELAQGHAGEAGREGELDGRGRAVQGVGDLRQGRQVHVHGQRGEGGEPAEYEGDQKARAACGRQGHCGGGGRGRCGRRVVRGGRRGASLRHAELQSSHLIYAPLTDPCSQ